MINKATMKKILTVLLVVLLLVSISSVCFASQVTMKPSEFKPNAGAAKAPIEGVTNLILGIAQVIALAVAVVMLVVLAVKYMYAAPAEKANIKSSAGIYVFGALLLFGGVAALNIIQRAGQDMTDKTAMVVYESRYEVTENIHN